MRGEADYLVAEERENRLEAAVDNAAEDLAVDGNLADT